MPKESVPTLGWSAEFAPPRRSTSSLKKAPGWRKIKTNPQTNTSTSIRCLRFFCIWDHGESFRDQDHGGSNKPFSQGRRFPNRNVALQKRGIGGVYPYLQDHPVSMWLITIVSPKWLTGMILQVDSHDKSSRHPQHRKRKVAKSVVFAFDRVGLTARNLGMPSTPRAIGFWSLSSGREYTWNLWCTKQCALQSTIYMYI